MVSTQYKSAFPVPRTASQPPNAPLLNPHPLQAFYELGLGLDPISHHTTSHAFSLLAPTSSGEFSLGGDTRVFARPAGSATAAAAALRAYTVEACLPFAHGGDAKGACPRRLRATADGPHLAVRHRLRVALLYSWAGGAPARLAFSIPLVFVHTPPAPRAGGAQAEAEGDARRASAESLASSARSAPYAPGARAPPAYSQLFWANGDRRVEDGLPRYEPVAEAPPGSL